MTAKWVAKEITLIFPRPAEEIEFRLYPPLGLLYLIAAFQKNGWETSFINGQLLAEHDYQASIDNIRTRIIGISTTITEIGEALRIARCIKENDPQKMIIFGGPGISAITHGGLSADNVDMVVQGEAENFPVMLVDLLASVSLEDWIRQRKLIGPAMVKCQPPQDLDAIPEPNRELLPLERYLENLSKEVGISIATMFSSRGCPYGCSFCDKGVSGKGFRPHSPQRVVGEMQYLYQRYSVDEIMLCDDFLCYQRDRVMSICEKLVKGGPTISWSAETRVDSVDLALLRKMKEAGCSQLCFGVESGSNRILRELHKGFTDSQVALAFDLCKQVGIKTGMCLIVAIPGETRADIEATIRLVQKCKPYELGVSYLVPFPGTEIYDKTKSWICHQDYSQWHRRSILYDYPYEVDPRVAREEIFTAFKATVNDGYSPFQFKVDY
ncbi:MAG: radical SAM protein [Patescibacteria group bacterium]|jgi:radical SAM superfamily enzyme YgiQ (UPF0313 family)